MSDDVPVRVLHVIKGLGPGGAERLLVSMASVAAAGFEHEVAYLLDWKQHLVPELEGHDVRTWLLAGPGGMGDVRWVARLRRLARRFDVVHFHSPAVAAIARPVLGTMRGGPVLVSTEHNVWPTFGWPTRVGNALTLPLDRVRWAVSDEVIASAWGPWRSKMETLVHGVPVAAFRARALERGAARVDMGWSEDDVVVATVANLRPQKDYPTLFSAAAEALEKEPRLRFVSIGQGALEGELRERLRSLGLGDRFVMLGYHEDPAAVVVGADMFTLASRREGLPIALLEAMALGVPGVVTKVGGNAEVVTDDVDGVLVGAGQPSELASAYVRLAQSPDARRRLGDAAARRAEDFDITGTARIAEERYRILVAGSRP